MKTLLAEVSANHCAPHVFTNPWNETLLPYQCHPESALQRSAHSVAFIRRGGMENRLGAPDERRVNHPAVDREGSHAVDPGFCRGIDYAHVTDGDVITLSNEAYDSEVHASTHVEARLQVRQGIARH